VKHLDLVVRGEGLEASMSKYLIERIAALPNVTLHTGTEVVQLEGEPGKHLEAAVFKDRKTGETERCELHHLFLFIGADPNANWLDGCVALDAHGFVLTGAAFAGPLLWLLPNEQDTARVLALVLPIHTAVMLTIARRVRLAPR